MSYAVAILSCLLATPLLAASNLLVRAEFPSDGIGGLTDWTILMPVEAERGVTRVPSAGPQGRTAIRIDFRKKNYLAQKGVRLVAGEPYRASAWVRTRNLPADHTYALQAWNKGWLKTFVNARFPADTSGKWTRVDWRGTAIESSDGTYSFAVVGGAPGAPDDASVEVCAPELVADSPRAEKESAPAAASPIVRTRIVPVDPLLAHIDLAHAAITFYYPGELPGASADYELDAAFDGERLSPVGLGADGRARVELGANRVAGEHRVEVKVREKATGRVVAADAYPVRLRNYPKPVEPRRLNNFVSEILKAPLRDTMIPFGLARDGWIHIAFSTDLPGAEAYLDHGAVPVVRHRDGERMETMRYLPAGWHRLTLRGTEGRKGTVTVRSVKTLVHCSPRFETAPSDLDARALRLDFYRRFGMMEFFNVPTAYFASRDGARYFDFGIPELEARGMRPASINSLTPWDDTRQHPDKVERFLAGSRAYRTGMDLLIDETSISSPRVTKLAFAEGLWRLIGGIPSVSVFNNDAPERIFTDRRAHATELAAIVNSGEGRGMLYPEVYPAALADEKAAFRWEDHFLDYVKSVERIVPAAKDRIVWYFGTFLTLGGWTDWPCPEADIRVLYAHFIHRLATDPEYAPYIGGLSASHFASTDEDVARWMAKLVRYYAIEGGTEYLPPKYGFDYNPGFLANCDFAEGLTNWTVCAAEADSVRAIRIANYGRDKQERKKAPAGTGDGLALMVRSAKGPNRLSQAVRGMKPGTTYSLTFCTSDYDDAKNPHDVKPGAFRVLLDGAREVPSLAYVHAPARKAGFTTWRGIPAPLCVTRRVVFTAEKSEVTVTFSDWAAEDAPGDAVGKGTLINWIHLHKYYLEKESDLGDLVELFSRKEPLR